MCRQNVMSRAGVRADQRVGDAQKERGWVLGRHQRERNTAFLAVKKHTQNRLGSLGEGGRAERPLKIRNGHVEQGQAKPGPGQQQRGKTGTCFGRQEREPYQGVAYPSPRAPAVTVATTRFFCPAQCGPRTDNTVELVGVYPNRLLGYRNNPGTCLPTSQTQRSTWLECMYVCARSPPALSGASRGRGKNKKNYIVLTGTLSHPLPVASHTRP